MKKSLTILLIFVFMFINVQKAFGAVHNAQVDFPYFGHDLGILTDNLTPPGTPWFSMGKDSHYLKIAATQINAGLLGLSTLYSVEEFQNDQMFGVLNYLSPANTFKYSGGFRCGYLFENGLDLGIDYHLTTDNSDNQQNSTVLSLGYRYNLKNAGYAALSVDYLYEQTVSGIYGYDLDFKYYLKKMRISGQVYQPTDLRATILNTVMNIRADFQLYDFLVLGGLLTYQSDNSNNSLLYQAGFTLTKPFFTINGKLGGDSKGVNLYTANASMKFYDNYSLGIEYLKKQTDSSPNFTYMANSDNGNLHFALTFTPAVNGNSSNWSLVYKVDPFNEEIGE